jgi:hypothetical protein
MKVIDFTAHLSHTALLETNHHHLVGDNNSRHDTKALQQTVKLLSMNLPLLSLRQSVSQCLTETKQKTNQSAPLQFGTIIIYLVV